MSKESGILRGRRKLWVIVAIIVVVIGIVSVILLNPGKDSGTEQKKASTQALERMDLEQIVTATGTVKAADSRKVTGTATSKVASVEVAEGDVVLKGAPLCTMDTTQLNLNIETTEKNLRVAKAQASEGIAQAKRRVSDAQDQYNYDDKRLSAEVKKAKKALDAARKASKSGTATSGKSVDIADSAMVTQTAQTAMVATANPTIPTASNPTATTGVASLQAAYDAAVSTRDATLRADRAAIKSARDALTTQELMDQTSSLQGQLDLYQQQKEDAILRAPIDGTVTTVNAKTGESPSMEGPLFVIEDIEHLEVVAPVPEFDASLLRTGLDVHIVSDAIQNGEWTGVIKQISPAATDDSGNFTVRISVTSLLENLKSGMSAKLNIVSDSRQGVFAVPYGALVTKQSGEMVVYILEESDGASEGSMAAKSGTQQRRREIAVTTGLETDYYVEIQGEGLAEGQLVLTDPEGLNTEAPEALPTYTMG
jgi:RND family efflux transporter MFP subunit